MPAELRFRAMGAGVHLVVDGPDSLLEVGRRHIDDLDARWSRFRPDSEISRLNAGQGWLTVLSPPTFELVGRALEGHRRTGGAFDPTVLGDVIRAGYDADFDGLAEERAEAPTSRWERGVGGIVVYPLSRAVQLPAGVAFDSGGIGKGLAADLVSAALIRAGAAGTCVNLGGDLRVRGTLAGERAWPLAIDHPDGSPGLARVVVGDGALATSSILRRSWSIAGQRRHHLIDPTTGRPAVTDVVSVSVLAGSCWEAEVLAKAGILAGSAGCLDIIDAGGGAALAVTAAAAVLTSAHFADFAVPTGVAA